MSTRTLFISRLARRTLVESPMTISAALSAILPASKSLGAISPTKLWMVRLGTWTPVAASNSVPASPLAHLRGEIGEPHPDASAVPASLHVQGLQDGGRGPAVAPPDDLLGFEPDLAEACDEDLGVGAAPPVAVASAVPGAAQRLNDLLLAPLYEAHELFP